MERADASMTITKPFPSAVVVAVALTAAHSSSFLPAVAEGARCWSRLRHHAAVVARAALVLPAVEHLFLLLPTRRARCSAKALFLRACAAAACAGIDDDWDDYKSIGYVVADHIGLELLDWQEVPRVCTGLCAVRGRRPPPSASLQRPAEP